MDISRIIYYY